MNSKSHDFLDVRSSITATSAHSESMAAAMNYQGTWEALGHAVPTITALATLCSVAMTDAKKHGDTKDPAEVLKHLEPDLRLVAKTILFAASRLGAIEIKISPRAFRPTERFLALHIPVNEDEVIVFQDPNDLKVAVEFLAAFAELCRSGLCLHQLQGEFSLSYEGYSVASLIHREEVEPWLNKTQNSHLL